MQNIGYFAPWSRQNSWADRIAINNIRKANTPQVLPADMRPFAPLCVYVCLADIFFLPFRVSVSPRPSSTLSPCPPSTHEHQSLALKQEQIEKENAKFARRCSLGYALCVYIYIC
jgi:hypothetical protein